MRLVRNPSIGRIGDIFDAHTHVIILVCLRQEESSQRLRSTDLVAIEAQPSSLSPETIQRRTIEYARNGIYALPPEEIGRAKIRTRQHLTVFSFGDKDSVTLP
jgi:hypothetical protein